MRFLPQMAQVQNQASPRKPKYGFRVVIEILLGECALTAGFSHYVPVPPVPPVFQRVAERSLRCARGE